MLMNFRAGGDKHHDGQPNDGREWMDRAGTGRGVNQVKLDAIKVGISVIGNQIEENGVN